MKRRLLALAAAPLAALALVLVPVQLATAPSARAFDPTKAPEIQQRLLDGLADFELKPSGERHASNHLSNYRPRSDDGCGLRLARDIKVNQNCLNLTDTDLQGRAQAQNETSIAADPSSPRRLVASYNDYRRGDGNCIGAFSNDSGKHWTDTIPPMGFTRGTAFRAARQYWQAGGDTSVAFDTRGNAYLSCQMFNRGAPPTTSPDTSSALYVFRSTGNGGASWNFPARPVIESPDVNGTGAADFLDKQLMTVDNHRSSPFRDRVYVSWTTFTAAGTAYIYSSYSADYGEHFSPPVLVSGDSAMCPHTYGLPTPNGRCNENQFSQPFTGADGNLYIVWANFNNAVTGADNRNQMLLARSTDGGQTFSAPVKVGDYYDLPDCATYQGGADPGRACVPEKGPTTHSIFRATNYPSAAVNPRNNAQIVVNYGSYINKYSNELNGCTPTGFSALGLNTYTGVKTPGACNNKILVSVSTNAGATFSGAATDPRSVTTAGTAAQAGKDQWFQWTDFSQDGTAATSYYDRQYGNDEVTGDSDITLAASKHLTHFRTDRVSSSSMPPPTQFGGVFWGDYTGLVVAENRAHPLWSDTRDVDLFVCPSSSPPQVCTGTESGGFQAGLTANDQDIFTASGSLAASG